MAVVVQCPNAACGRSSRVPEANLGHRGRCPHCGTVFRLAPTQPESPPPSPLPDTVIESRPAEVDAAEAEATNGAAARAGVPRRIGRFQVRERLGAGAFGAVYRAV